MVNKKISVVVCTKNEEKYIGQCLKHLVMEDVPCEIIVVDARSTDNTLKIARKYADKIVFDHGGGISDARNVGWKNASSEIVAYCDCDSIPPKDWTRRILQEIKGLYCVSGPIISYDGSISMKIKFFLWGSLFPRVMSKLGYHSVWGANMAFRKSILKKYPFRFRFLEDYDMGVRLRKTFKVRFCSSLKLPVSSRRFKEGFGRICIKYYIREWLGRKTRRSSTTGYFK
ncbi:MAG: glycosyltransferase [archaeon]|nr:MAG: glycosyltransferase [archaeon]